jgi:hypothetical protein
MAPGWYPPEHTITQAYGFCFTDHGLVALVKTHDGFRNLPGGQLEPGETTPRARGRRGSLRPRDRLLLPGLPTRLGPPRPRRAHQPLPDPLVARIELDPWQPNHETIARQLVPPGDVLTTLSWHRKQIAGRLLDLALAAEHAYRRGDQ